jgi:hypothetical protein
MQAALERHADYLGEALADLPQEFIDSCRVITPETPFSSSYRSDRVNIVVDGQGRVAAILTG